jgi:hypothetical protein
MLKQIFGILTALIAAVLIIFMAQMIREGLYPQPSGLQFTNKEEVMNWFNSLPSQAFIIIAISHGLAAFAAGLITSMVSDRYRMTYGVIVVSVIFIFVMIYLFTYSFPVWFVLTDTIVTGVLGFVGVVTGSAKYIS